MSPRNRVKGKASILLVVAGLSLMAYALWEIAQTPDRLQYIVQADPVTDVSDPDAAADSDAEAYSPLRRRIAALEDSAAVLEQAAAVYTLSGAAPQVTLSADDAGAAAGLKAVGSDHFVLYPALLLQGRFPNPEESDLGERVILLDELLALDLFRMTEVVDREVKLEGAAYRVIGVLRHQKRVGDDADRYAYIPLLAAAKAGIRLETLCLSAAPVAKGGAMLTFAETARQWMPGGNAYDLRRERVGAGIWARFFACGVGYALLAWSISKYIRSVGALRKSIDEKLADRYVARLLPYLLFHILLRVVALAALAVAAAALTNLLLEPVKVYPEFVPDILVEPAEIAKTFWALRDAESDAVVIRTPQIVRLLYFGRLCNIAVILTLWGGCLAFSKRRRR